jgi:hypothetical protein
MAFTIESLIGVIVYAKLSARLRAKHRQKGISLGQSSRSYVCYNGDTRLIPKGLRTNAGVFLKYAAEVKFIPKSEGVRNLLDALAG